MTLTANILLGAPGSGKGTQTALLCAYLKSQGRNVYPTAEPTESVTGGMIRDVLSGARQRTSSELAALFLADRVAHNMNISFAYVEGESLMMAVKDLAVSSGSACTSASLEPSYVLRALGRNDELAHSSIRFSIGRYTTEAEIDYAVQLLHAKIQKLRDLSPLWEMYKDGIDLNTVQWAAH